MSTGRGKWLVWSVLAPVVFLVAAVLVGAAPALVQKGNASLARGTPLAAEQHFASATTFPAAEAWIPLFNRGVARYDQEKWDAAADDFEHAALRAPQHMLCPISLNWSAALEAGGDALAAQDDASGAGLRYRESLMVLALAVCPEDQPGASGSQADDWDEARQRVAQKSSSSPDRGEPSEGGPEPDAAQELEERIAQAQQERHNAEQLQDPREGGHDGERTW